MKLYPKRTKFSAEKKTDFLKNKINLQLIKTWVPGNIAIRRECTPQSSICQTQTKNQLYTIIIFK